MKMEIYDATNRIDRPALSVMWFSLSIEDEEQVSGLGLREFQMRFGSAQLKMGGIEGVNTKEEHRNKGYSRRVMEVTMTFMAENGYDVSMLFGIRDFYHKFGYATVIPEIWIDFGRGGSASGCIYISDPQS